MTFHDLPPDWPQRSLVDPLIAVDVVDLCVSDADRTQGCLALLLCRESGALAQPVVLDTHGCPDVPHLVTTFLEMLPDLPGVGGVVLAVARPWGGPQDADRVLHRCAEQVCRDRGLALWGTYLATPAGVTALSCTGAPVRRSLRDPDTAA